MNEVIVAPFSNSDIRDWPLDRYAEAIGLLLPRLPGETTVLVTGTASQRLRVNEVVRGHPADRVINSCGRLSWNEVVGRLRTAACIISNNSGVCHLGGYFDVPTVCVFGASHPRAEWRPLGRRIVLVSRAIGCSPCQLDHSTGSPYAKACLRDITPEVVVDAVVLAMGLRRPPALPSAGLPGPERGGSQTKESDGGLHVQL
jgi:ADP-heptose:LPS heptosyltransferase